MSGFSDDSQLSEQIEIVKYLLSRATHVDRATFVFTSAIQFQRLLDGWTEVPTSLTVMTVRMQPPEGGTSPFDSAAMDECICRLARFPVRCFVEIQSVDDCNAIAETMFQVNPLKGFQGDEPAKPSDFYEGNLTRYKKCL